MFFWHLPLLRTGPKLFVLSPVCICITSNLIRVAGKGSCCCGLFSAISSRNPVGSTSNGFFYIPVILSCHCMSFHAFTIIDLAWFSRMPNVCAAMLLHLWPGRIRCTAFEVCSWNSWNSWNWKCPQVPADFASFKVMISDAYTWKKYGRVLSIVEAKPEQNRSTESAKAVEAGMVDQVCNWV